MEKMKKKEWEMKSEVLHGPPKRAESKVKMAAALAQRERNGFWFTWIWSKKRAKHRTKHDRTTQSDIVRNVQSAEQISIRKSAHSNFESGVKMNGKDEIRIESDCSLNGTHCEFWSRLDHLVWVTPFRNLKKAIRANYSHRMQCFTSHTHPVTFNSIETQKF